MPNSSTDKNCLFVLVSELFFKAGAKTNTAPSKLNNQFFLSGLNTPKLERRFDFYSQVNNMSHPQMLQAMKKEDNYTLCDQETHP